MMPENKTKMTNEMCMRLLRQRMRDLFWKIAREGEKITIDGVPGYNEKAQFVGGKVINLCSYVALSFSENESEKKQMLIALKEIIARCAIMEMETWGILNGLTGIYRLKQAGVYDEVLSRETEEKLKRVMDWHTFVDEKDDYALIHKPTNYYGVAFGIARWRELLGWDQKESSRILLDHLLSHIAKYSGEYGFMDETKGEGRFDRYSILIPAEITELVLKTGWKEPELIRKMLGKSAQIVLQMANKAGWGFSYGRSIGAYGETAALQILASAAQLGGVLTKKEEQVAYCYSLYVIRKMILFWYDEQMQSVNLWDKGRRTDGYRNKNRILGENLSLSMQVIDVLEQWKALGYQVNETEESNCDFGEDGLFFTQFAKEPYDRGLLIYRWKEHVWSLPVISGGTPYYDKDAYLPVPRENGVLEAVPDVNHGALVPRLVLEDGSELMPICYSDSITKKDKNSFSIHFNRLCLLGENMSRSWEGSATTTYRFLGSEIEREDVIRVEGNVPVREICLCFDTFSEEPTIEDEKISFNNGPIREIQTKGYGQGTAKRIKCLPQKEFGDFVDFSVVGMKTYETSQDSFDTPHGPNQTQVIWKRAYQGENEIRLLWRIKF